MAGKHQAHDTQPGRADLQVLRSFDGGYSCVARVSSARDEIVHAQAAVGRRLIPRGQGLSYASASFGAYSVSVDMKACSRILGFDDATGDVLVEAGATLREVTNFLLPRRRYLPVMPGHSEITVGGCIAADVHGKNQVCDGTFRRHVEELQLFHPDHGAVALSRTKLPDIFEATTGGYGLTGLIVSARLRTTPLRGAAMKLTARIIDTPAAAAAMMSELSAKSAVVYSWHDFLAKNDRGLVISGEFGEATTSIGAPLKRYELTANGRAVLPFSLQGRIAGRLINAIFATTHSWRRQRRVGFGKAFFPATGSESYFRLFGAHGFHEYQVIAPFDNFASYVQEARQASRKHGVPIVLASGKLFEGSPSLLRFDGGGVCFAINVPRTARSQAFLAELDEIAMAHQCRPNIIKDSRLPRRVVEACYGEYGRFKSLLRDWDPGRRFQSELSERLGL